jgi:hypothetical protein
MKEFGRTGKIAIAREGGIVKKFFLNAVNLT